MNPPPYEDFIDGHSLGATCVINRHDGGMNSLFLDWSVRKVGLKEPWTLKWHREFDTANKWTLAGGVQPEDWPEWMRKFKDY
jgi:prepilin-type processing-associated H-X9-DG protein